MFSVIRAVFKLLYKHKKLLFRISLRFLQHCFQKSLQELPELRSRFDPLLHQIPAIDCKILDTERLIFLFDLLVLFMHESSFAVFAEMVSGLCASTSAY